MSDDTLEDLLSDEMPIGPGGELPPMGPKRRRRGYSGLAEELSALTEEEIAADPVLQVLEEQTRDRAERAAVDGKTPDVGQHAYVGAEQPKAGHTEKDKPTDDTPDAGSW